MLPRLFLSFIFMVAFIFPANTTLAAVSALPKATVIQVNTSSQLTSAINSISDGGIIELASGTYNSPSSPSYGGFQISDLRKGFTIRAAAGATVYLDGQGSRVVFRFQNSSLSAQKPVTFSGLIFRNGYSNTAGLAAGVTLQNAEATFINCNFTNNNATANAAGGATQVSNNSVVLFMNSSWSGNTTPVSGAAIEIQEHSKVYIHASQFSNNRTNIPNHTTYSAGGAIHIGNSTVRISNSRFENNQAGYVGGAVYAIGQYTNSITTDVIIANSTFVNNKAVNDPSVSLSVPTEAGAFHAESKVNAKIYNSRFITNQAQSGGAVMTYRASITIEGSVFLGNQATGTGDFGGGGGAISMGSSDTSVDGNTNRPSASLTMKDSYIQGRYGSVSNVAQVGGGIYAGGDINRMYGWGGATKIGTLNENRAQVNLDRVAFVDLDTLGQSGKTGGGGAVLGDLAAVAMTNCIIVSSNATGSGSYGGALTALDQTEMSVSSTTMAKNSAETYGGNLFGQGSNILISGSKFLENSVSTTFGSAIFAAVESNRNFNMTGNVQNSTFVNNNSPHIFDDDRTNGPINTVTYNQNSFYPSGTVYKSSLSSNQTVSGLNNLVINRSNGTSTDKATIANTELSSIPVSAAILAAPEKVLSSGAVGDSGAQKAYLTYGWVGGSATLNGAAVSGNAGWSNTAITGTHTLTVASTSFTASVSQAPTPAATLIISKTSYPYTLTWSLNSGTFLEAMIDNHANITSASSGSVSVSPVVEDAPYWLYMLTKEGGIVVSAASEPKLSVPTDVYVLAGANTNYDPGSIPVRNVGGGSLSWTATNNSTNMITLHKTSGSTQTSDAVPFTVLNSLSEGSHTATVSIGAGTAGSQTVTVHITVYNTLYQVHLPGISR